MNATSALPVPAVSWSGYFEALALVCFLLAFLWAVLWLVKKRGGGFVGSSSVAMRIESRLALGPKKWILVTRVQDTRLVLGVTDQQINLLAELPVDMAAEQRSAAKGKSFASLLGKQQAEAAAPAAPPAGQGASSGQGA